MEALRQIRRVHGHSLSVTLPESFREKWVEIIVLPLPPSPVDVSATSRRRPPPELSDCEIKGDIMAPTTKETDWDALR